MIEGHCAQPSPTGGRVLCPEAIQKPPEPEPVTAAATDTPALSKKGLLTRRRWLGVIVLIYPSHDMKAKHQAMWHSF